MMRQKPTARALRANCSLLCITKSNPTKPLQWEGGGLGWVLGLLEPRHGQVCQSPSMAGFAVSVTVCPQLPATDSSFQVLEKKNCKEKCLACFITKSTNHHPQTEKDEGPPSLRVSDTECDFPRR